MPDFVAAFLAGIPPKRAAAAAVRRSAITAYDFSHLVAAPAGSAVAPIAAAAVPFAEKMMAAIAATRNETYDPREMAAVPVQRRVVATGADILAAARKGGVV